MANAPDKVLEQIQKLLNLAANNPSEAEAASAAAKAQQLCEEWNLSVDSVSEKNVGSGAREQSAVIGGLYVYQKELWGEVAKLNFCLYWRQRVWDKNASNKAKYRKYREWGDSIEDAKNAAKGKYVFRHLLVGRKINVAATKAMATYIEQVVDRLTLERLGGDNSQRWSNWANSYRRGIVARVCQKLVARRNEVVAAEHARRAAAERASDNPSSATELTLSTYIDQETDANIDFVYGEGTSAKWASQRAESAAKAKAEREAYTKWAAENPEEARKTEEERRAQAGRHRSRGGRIKTDKDNIDRSAYWSGYDAGEKVSIDPQVDEFKPAGLL